MTDRLEVTRRFAELLSVPVGNVGGDRRGGLGETRAAVILALVVPTEGKVVHLDTAFQAPAAVAVVPEPLSS